MSSKKIYRVLIVFLFLVFILTLFPLVFDEWLAENIDVIGIRISVLIVAFASFCASSVFSIILYIHNRTVSKLNDDQNKRAGLYRDMQFASSNYSIIEFMDRMLFTKESTRYMHKFHEADFPSYHLIHNLLDENSPLSFYTIRIPFQVIDGKLVSHLSLTKITFEKDNQHFYFIPMHHETIARTYSLYNERTKRNNLIINLVFNKNSGFFDETEINEYSKIKIYIKITSVLGVSVSGISELYFTNPTQIEGDESHTYKINSSNFRLTTKPFIDQEHIEEHNPE